MTLKSKILKVLEILMFIVIFVAIDQYTKYLICNRKDREVFKPIIKHVFGFEYLENTGVAFGMAAGLIVPIIVFVIVITVVLTYFIYVLEKTIYKYNHLKIKFSIIIICFQFMIAGAIGNLIDRIRYKYVVDFIKLSFINFPTFNVADCYVTVSAFVLLVVLIFTKEDELNLIKIRK